MKKVIIGISAFLLGALILIAIAVFVVVPFFDLGPTSCAAVSDFYYSSDKGHSYGDGTKEYAIGDTVYMKVKFKEDFYEWKAGHIYPAEPFFWNNEPRVKVYLPGYAITVFMKWDDIEVVE